MKLHILSDLHLEFAEFDPPATGADVIILAGDIDVGLDGLEWAATTFIDTPVIYVPGNHEYYHNDLQLLQQMQQESADNVFVLDNEEMIIGRVRFLGATLWTDFAVFEEFDSGEAMQYARTMMSDFIVIQNDERPFTPEQSAGRHRQSRKWLQQRLAIPYEGHTVVVTHHAPSPRSIHPRFADDPLTPAFSSDLEALMDGNNAQLWVHGHTHDAFDYVINGTRVVCNPRGYALEESGENFNPGLVVDLA